MTSSKLEFMVENIRDSKELEAALLKNPVISKAAVLRNEVVLLETALRCDEAADLLQNLTGGRAVIQGFGEGGTAVAMMDGSAGRGVIRLSGAQQNGGLVDGTIDGLPPGEHRLQVHVAGDISQGCNSLGPVWKPFGKLGNIKVGLDGRSTFKFVVPQLQVSQLIGRSLAIATDKDKRLACGIIARSAGLFENSKKICACDGITLWDERNVPAAGLGRRAPPANTSENPQSNV